VNETAPCTSSVHFGSFIQIQWDGLQPGKNTQNHEREELPDTDDDERRHDVIFSHPTDGIFNNADGEQKIVDQTKLIVEKPLPEDDGHHRRDHVWKEDDSPNEVSPSKRFVENQCRDDPNHDLENDGTDRIDRSIPDAHPEIRIPHQIQIVRKACEFLVWEK